MASKIEEQERGVIARAEEAQMCEACCRMRAYKMFMLQNGEAAWVCKDCRSGVRRS